MKVLTILGSTGSIGVSTLDVVAQFPDRYRVAALCAGSNLPLLAQQIMTFKPQLVSVALSADVDRLRVLLGDVKVEILCGVAGAVACAVHRESAMVVSAIVGAAGLVPTLAAINAGKDIALANKESLVMAGALVTQAAAHNKVQLLPVDSEHSAIFQVLAGQRKQDVRKLILTASGGPFRHHTLKQLNDVTLEQALAHPNWTMGKKISIDSATMMNKGLEVIEARWLFDVAAADIDVYIHPQSVIHSMVEFIDGAVLAQLGVPDMKTPIACALAWPERLPVNIAPLDLCASKDLSFTHPDLEQFRCLSLAYQALSAGGSAPVVLNAANEVAVDNFTQQNIKFVDIPSVIDAVLQSYPHQEVDDVDDVLHINDGARAMAQRHIESFIK